MSTSQVLPGTGRGTATRSGVVEGVLRERRPLRHAPSVSLREPPPRPGEDLAGASARLAGLSGVLFGWSPDAFWGATPAELAALVAALSSEEQAAPPEAGLVARMMEAFPDG